MSSQPLLSPTQSGINGGGINDGDFGTVAGRMSPLRDLSDVKVEGGKKDGEEGHVNQLGTLNGCYVPCLLNIMGIVLFMRLPWATGQAGVRGILGGVALAEAMALPTVLSISAIATNGNMEGGGSYFMISRSLGPELGGGIGILFYTAYAIGVAFYIIGFSTEVQSSFPIFSSCICAVNATNADGVCMDCNVGHLYAGKEASIEATEWTVAYIGSISLAFCLAISLKGAGFFAKFNVIFFGIQMFATAWGIISFLVPHYNVNPNGATIYNQSSVNGSVHFLPAYDVRFSLKNLEDNWGSEWEPSPQCQDQKCTFKLMFAIIFPMATGIMEGANLSGDQKEPHKSIPIGTLWAVFTSACTYLVLILCFAGSFSRKTLINDLNVFQNSALQTPYIVIVGILISSLSSGLGSLFGGSRILQAIAKDKLYPVLNKFAYASKNGGEPLVAVMGTWVISQGCVLIGNLDAIAPIISSIFCLSYALVNLTTFALAISGAPNFRPMFRYWSKWTALLGAVVNIFVMFWLDYKHGIIGVGVLLLLVFYLFLRAPATEWGDVSQALMFHQVRKYLLKMGKRTHPKFWRPNMLLLVDNPNLAVIGFCNSIKKGGLLVTGHVIIGELENRFEDMVSLRAMWQNANQSLGIKAFSHVTVAPTARLGYQFLLTCGGLGGLDINTVVLPLLRGLSRAASDTSINNLMVGGDSDTQPEALTRGGEEDDEEDGEEVDALLAAGGEGDADASMMSNAKAGASLRVNLKDAGTYCSVLGDAILAKKNLVLTRNFGTQAQKSKKGMFGLPSRKGHIFGNKAEKKYIDVWIIDDWGFSTGDPVTSDQDVMLLFQLGEILNHKLKEDRHELRIMYIPKAGVIDRGEPSPWNRCNNEEGTMDLKQQLEAYCFRMRVRPNAVHVIDAREEPEGKGLDRATGLTGLPVGKRAEVLNEIIASHNEDTTQIILTLPRPPKWTDEEACADYLDALRCLTDSLCPTAMAMNGEHVSFVYSGI